MALFTAYEAVGVKEDISDIIVNLSPTKTPWQSGLGNEKVTQKFFQWQEDTLRAVAVNAKIDGADAVVAAIVPTVMRSNNTQILSETVLVSGSMDATSTYGRAKESAYQMTKSSNQVKRDLENAMVGIDQATVVGDDTATARKMASYSQLITVASNVVNCGIGVTLDETHLLTALQNCYNSGAEPNVVSVTPTNSLSVAAFAKASGRFRTINDQGSSPTKVVNAVDLYVSPFGEVKIILNRFQKSTWTLVYDNSMWVKATLRPWSREALAKTGDANKNMLLGEFSLKNKAFLGSTVIVDNSTTGF